MTNIAVANANHRRLKKGVFIADVFDASIEIDDYGKAYIESFEFDTMQEAIKDLNNYQLGLSLDDLK